MKTTLNNLTAMKNIVFSCLLLITFGSFGQQLDYSQYQMTPMLNNPSLIALSEEIKVDLGYRNQYGGKGSNYATPLFAAYMPFYQEVGRDVFKKLGAAGIQVLTDRTGINGMLATTGFSATYAHVARLSRAHWVSFALQPGIYQRRVDFSKLTSGSQWDGTLGGYVGGDLGENIQATERRNFFTLNAGVTYVIENLRGDPFIVLSAGANNLTKPNVSLNAQTFSNPVYWNIQGSVRAFETKEFLVKPTFRVVQKNSLNQTNIGSYFYYKVEEKKGILTKGSIGLGLWYSNNNAVVTAIEINQKDWALAFSYDFLTSKLSDANNSTGAPEIIIGFRKFIGKGHRASSDVNASGSQGGGGGSGGGKLKDPKKAVPSNTEITPEPEVKPGDGKSGEDNKPAVDRDKAEQKADQPALENKEKETEKAAPESPAPAKEEKKEVDKSDSKQDNGSKSQSKPAPSKSKPRTKAPLKSNLSPEMTEKLANVVTSDEDLGQDPYAGTPLALNKKQREIFKKQPRYVKGSAVIDDVTKSQLSDIAKIMKSKPKLKLEINGFACSLGTKEVNKIVSKARAEMVKKFLLSKGISPSRLATKGNDFENPVGDNSTEEGRIANRRVQFKFVP